MPPPKSREQSNETAVLARDVAGLDRRVTVLEADMKDREDSSEGIQRELAEHRIEDAKAIAEVKSLIGSVEQKISDADAKLRSMRWMLGILSAIGLSLGLAILAKVWR